MVNFSNKKDMSVETINLTWEIKSKRIVDEVSLKINQGEILTILGPNGAGKSSFLKLCFLLGVFRWCSKQKQ